MIGMEVRKKVRDGEVTGVFEAVYDKASVGDKFRARERGRNRKKWMWLGEDVCVSFEVESGRVHD